MTLDKGSDEGNILYITHIVCVWCVVVFINAGGGGGVSGGGASRNISTTSAKLKPSRA